MQHMVNKAYTRWVTANLISGHLVHAGNQEAWVCKAQTGSVQCSVSSSL